MRESPTNFDLYDIIFERERASILTEGGRRTEGEDEKCAAFYETAW